MSISEHFSTEAWADYARDVATPDDEIAMRRHLADGCQACTELHESLRAIVAVGGADAAYEPPAGALRVARAAFNIEEAPGPLSHVFATVKLLFDSQLAPAMAGVRTVLTGPRKLLFACGDRVVELQFGPANEGHRHILIGQVTTARQTDRLEGLPVELLRGKTPIAKSSTTRFGEFQTEFDGPLDSLNLKIGLDPAIILISLNMLTKAQS